MKYWPLFLLAALFPVTVFLSNYTHGEPTLLQAQVISMGVGHSSTGSSVFLVCKTTDNKNIRVFNETSRVINVGDMIELLSFDRLLFSDRYSLVLK